MYLEHFVLVPSSLNINLVLYIFEVLGFCKQLRETFFVYKNKEQLKHLIIPFKWAMEL